MSMINSVKSREIKIGETISRAWRLYRVNFGKIIGFSLVLHFILAINFPLFLLHAQSKTLNTPEIQDHIMQFITVIVYFVIVIAVFVVSIYSIIKGFYKLLNNEELYYTDMISEASSYFMDKLKVIVNIFLESLVVLAILAFSYVAIYAILGIISYIFDVAICFGAVSLIVTAVMSFVGVIFISVFFYLIMLQLIIFVVEDKTFWPAFRTSIEIFLTDIPKNILFSFCLFSLYAILYSYFNLPIVLVREFYITPPASNVQEYILLLGGSLLNAIVWPMAFSGMVLYYFQIKAKTQGLDLGNQLLKERYGNYIQL